MTPGNLPLLRGAVVGLGVMGCHHLRLLRSLADVDLVAVVDTDPERRAGAEGEPHGRAAYATLADATAHHELDFVCVATPVAALPEVCTQALACGLHVLVEKPTAPTEEQARAMIATAQEHGLMLGVGHIERCNPAVVALKQKLEAGVIGRVLQMQARRLSPFRQRQGSAGVALDLATHDIDVMRYITGQEVARVYAETEAPLDADAHEDLLCATLRFDDGTVGLLETNRLTPAKVRQLSVLGERGMLVVDYLTQDLILYEHPSKATRWDHLAAIRGGGEGDVVRFGIERREPLLVQWRQFLDAMRAGQPAPISGHDGLASLSTALAIRASGLRQAPVVPGYRTDATAAG